MLVLGSTALLFDGCCEKPRVVVKKVYVHSTCPRLQTFEVNTTQIEPLQIDYEVIDVK